VDGVGKFAGRRGYGVSEAIEDGNLIAVMFFESGWELDWTSFPSGTGKKWYMV